MTAPSYSPEPLGGDLPEVVRQLQQELQRIAAVLQDSTACNIRFLNVAPAKPREGMIFGADGTNWNPGSGKGIYGYYGGSWVKL